MPLYEYRCTSCGYTFEKIQSFSAEPETVCPKCQGVLIRPVTAPALRFEGAGWYVNDYAGKGGAKAGEAAAKPADGASEAASSSGASEGSGASGGSEGSGTDTSSAKMVPSAPAAPTSTSTSTPAASPAKS